MFILSETIDLLDVPPQDRMFAKTCLADQARYFFPSRRLAWKKSVKIVPH